MCQLGFKFRQSACRVCGLKHCALLSHSFSGGKKPTQMDSVMTVLLSVHQILWSISNSGAHLPGFVLTILLNSLNLWLKMTFSFTTVNKDTQLKKYTCKNNEIYIPRAWLRGSQWQELGLLDWCPLTPVCFHQKPFFSFHYTFGVGMEPGDELFHTFLV